MAYLVRFSRISYGKRKVFERITYHKTASAARKGVTTLWGFKKVRILKVTKIRDSGER